MDPQRLAQEDTFSIIFGVFFGLAANRMLKYSQFHDLIDKQSFIAFYLALSVNYRHLLLHLSLLVAYNVFNEFDRMQ